jgi:tetratricopeptide (TPR) repeat protein
MTEFLTVRSHGLMWLTALCPLLAHELPALQWQVPSCEQYEAAVRADPGNLDAASRLGRCAVRDYELVAPDGDSTRLRFRSSWSTALRATRHAVDLDPSYAPAYRPLFAILFAEARDACSAITGECRHVAPVVRNGDTVITIPRLVHSNGAEPDTYAEAIRESRAVQRSSLIEARDLALRWAGVAPNDRQPHEYLGRALLRLGDSEAAAAALERAATLGTPESRRRLFWERVEAFVKSDRGEDVRRLIDEASTDPGRDTARVRVYKIASLNALVGRFRPPSIDSARVRALRPRIDSMIRHNPPPSPPPKGITDLLAVGDSVGARRLLAGMDSAIASRSGGWVFPRVGPEHLGLATYHLALRDTAGAEARLAEIEQPLQEHPFEFSVGIGYGGDPRPWLGRAWLLSGDLAAARHRPEDAARMYRRVIGLWGGGDPDLQPVVHQARAKLGALSSR